MSVIAADVESKDFWVGPDSAPTCAACKVGPPS